MRKVAMALMLALLMFPSGIAFAESWLMPSDSCDLEAGTLLDTPPLILVFTCPTNIVSTCPVAPSTEEPEFPELREEPGPVSGIMLDPMGKFNQPWTAVVGPDCGSVRSNTSVELNRLASLIQSIMVCETDEFIKW